MTERGRGRWVALSPGERRGVRRTLTSGLYEIFARPVDKSFAAREDAEPPRELFKPQAHAPRGLPRAAGLEARRLLSPAEPDSYFR